MTNVFEVIVLNVFIVVRQSIQVYNEVCNSIPSFIIIRPTVIFYDIYEGSSNLIMESE